MSHRVRVPAFRQHRYGHDAADRSTEPIFLPHRVHDFTEQVFVAQAVRPHAIPRAVHLFPAKALDLVSRSRTEPLVETLPRFELGAVDEQGSGPRPRVAVVVEVAEQLEPTGHDVARPALVLSLIAGDVVEEQFGRRRVVADHDEAGRTHDSRFSPSLEDRLVVPIEGIQGVLER